MLAIGRGLVRSVSARSLTIGPAVVPNAATVYSVFLSTYDNSKVVPQLSHRVFSSLFLSAIADNSCVPDVKLFLARQHSRVCRNPSAEDAGQVPKTKWSNYWFFYLFRIP